jgi:hypothetical protein
VHGEANASPVSSEWCNVLHQPAQAVLCTAVLACNGSAGMKLVWLCILLLPPGITRCTYFKSRCKFDVRQKRMLPTARKSLHIGFLGCQCRSGGPMLLHSQQSLVPLMLFLRLLLLAAATAHGLPAVQTWQPAQGLPHASHFNNAVDSTS